MPQQKRIEKYEVSYAAYPQQFLYMDQYTPQRRGITNTYPVTLANVLTRRIGQS